MAIDAATGELLWMYRLDEGKRSAAAPRLLSGRNVAYWTDGRGDERIFMVTIGYQLVALERQERESRSRASARTASSISSRTTIRCSIRLPAKSD